MFVYSRVFVEAIKGNDIFDLGIRAFAKSVEHFFTSIKCYGQILHEQPLSKGSVVLEANAMGIKTLILFMPFVSLFFGFLFVIFFIIEKICTSENKRS